MCWSQSAIEPLLASASFDGSVRVWRLESEARELVSVYAKAGAASQNGLDWAPCPAPLLGAVSSSGEIQVIYLSEGHWSYLAALAPTILTSICWAPAGSQQTLALGLRRYHFGYVGCDRSLTIAHADLDQQLITPVYSLKDCHANWVRDISWSAASAGDVQLIATASEDKTCKVWRVDLGKREAASQTIALNSPVWRVFWNFVGNLLAIALTSIEGSNIVQIYREGDNRQWELHSQLP